MLEASPWSRVIKQETVVGPMVLGTDAPKFSEDLIVLLRSALPIRQALLRERQLASKYDSMNQAERTAFDAKNKALLECPACGKYYVISVKCTYTACYGGTFVEDYKKSFYLASDKGERRDLAGASALPDKTGGAVFFFPRLSDKGEPLLTPESKDFTFHFAIRTVVNLDVVNKKQKFDVSKLVQGGQVVF